MSTHSLTQGESYICESHTSNLHDAKLFDWCAIMHNNFLRETLINHWSEEWMMSVGLAPRLFEGTGAALLSWRKVWGVVEGKPGGDLSQWIRYWWWRNWKKRIAIMSVRCICLSSEAFILLILENWIEALTGTQVKAIEIVKCTKKDLCCFFHLFVKWLHSQFHFFISLFIHFVNQFLVLFEKFITQEIWIHSSLECGNDSTADCIPQCRPHICERLFS